jgi:hypothetical protein
MVPRNVGVPPQHYTATQPRRPRLELHRRENLKSRISYILTGLNTESYQHVIFNL